MHSARRTDLLTGCLAAALVLATSTGCGATAPSRPAPAAADLPSAGFVEDYVSLTVNQLVTASELAVIARVTEVGPLRWNSESGTPWGPTPQDPLAFPLTLRDLEVAVEQVVFAGEQPVGVGQVLVVRQEGPASIRDVPGADRVHNLAATGHVAVGDRLLLLLAEHPLPMQSGRLLAGLEPVNGYQAVWQVRDATAVSADPQRTVPLADLLARLRLERTRGEQPYPPGDVSAGNPLAPPVSPPAPLPPVPCFGSGCDR